jgi:energy-converting hydrogenase Eha subunit C
LSHAVQLSILFLNLSDGFKVSSLNTIDAAAAVDVATAGVASSPIDLLILLLLVFISESESKSFSKSKIYF